MLRICLFLLVAFHTALSLRICSFNVRSFGEAKRTRPEIMDIIVEIISRCDIMLLMEIKDSGHRLCPFLLEKLNGCSHEQYDYVVSNRLGRKSYKEQYAFFYRLKMVSVKQTYQYPDLQPGDEDALSREPFVIWFSSPKTVAKEFVIIPLHTTPETAVREIDELYDVYLDVKQHWTSKNFIFMGDFNAGCSYIAKKHWKNIRLRNNTQFVWLIGDNHDTTVKASTRCPYDRIVLHGDKLINAVVPNSATIFDFQSAFSMTEMQKVNRMIGTANRNKASVEVCIDRKLWVAEIGSLEWPLLLLLFAWDSMVFFQLKQKNGTTRSERHKNPQ